jgi:hypothetical protein
VTRVLSEAGTQGFSVGDLIDEMNSHQQGGR